MKENFKKENACEFFNFKLKMERDVVFYKNLIV